jgi:ferric enterobactin receptor
MNLSTGYSFNKYNEFEKNLYKYRDGGSYNINLHYNFLPNPLLTIDGNIRYNNFADPQGKSRSNVSFNLGVQKKLFDKRLVVSFNIIDPFQAMQFTSFTYGRNFLLENFNASVTKNYKISISYQLNKIVQKPIAKTNKKVK